jgi:hypothetical protein
MKKLLLVLALALILSVSVFADHPGGLGIGIQGGYYGGWESGSGAPGAALSLKLPSIPIFWAISAHGESNFFTLGVAGDLYLIENALVPQINLHWHAGLGGWVGIGLGGDDLVLALGARVPIGLHIHLLDNFLELFLGVAPNLGVVISPEFHFPAGGWPIELGIRIWLK